MNVAEENSQEFRFKNRDETTGERAPAQSIVASFVIINS